MINTPEALVPVLQDMLGEADNPEEFWQSVGLDFPVVRLIAMCGEMIGMGDDTKLLAAMQLGAQLALKGLAGKNDGIEL